MKNYIFVLLILCFSTSFGQKLDMNLVKTMEPRNIASGGNERQDYRN